MMLETPKGHVRQRSSFVIEESEMPRPQAPLLGVEMEEAYYEKPSFIIGQPRRDNVTLTGLWALSLVLTALCTAAIIRTSQSTTNQGFDAGYETELRDARSVIKLHKQQFQGSLDFKARHGFIPEGSPSLEYVGSTVDVDSAWEELTKDRYFLLSDAEAREAYGSGDISKYWNEHHGGYASGLDVLHTLHCLNHLRKSLYPKVYPQDPQNTVTHSAHCIDHLRQLAMCQGDLTPIPTQYFPGLGQNYINSSREHTCREFGPIRNWATERFNGSTAVKARNRDGTPRANFYGPWG